MAMDVTATGTGVKHHGKTGTGSPKSANFFDHFAKLPDSRFRTTGSGLKVAVIKEGRGEPLTNGMVIKIKYTGWTSAGVEFDSSTDRGKPFSFRLGSGQVIKGWEEGLVGIKPGERRQLIIPAELAYGDRQVGKIPPGATLIFNVEAVSVEEGHSNPKGNVSVMA